MIKLKHMTYFCLQTRPSFYPTYGPRQEIMGKGFQVADR